MLGNVYEWCQDSYGNYSNTAQTDPTVSAVRSYRVIRGGYFLNDARGARPADRNQRSQGSRFNNVGARLLRTK
ncbi:MAG: SUMF1/EgtB/PvdO family nonheme iron enzyme [bacterium]